MICINIKETLDEHDEVTSRSNIGIRLPALLQRQEESRGRRAPTQVDGRPDTPQGCQTQHDAKRHTLCPRIPLRRVRRLRIRLKVLVER